MPDGKTFWGIKLEKPCKHLIETGQGEFGCAIYDRRPYACRIYASVTAMIWPDMSEAEATVRCSDCGREGHLPAKAARRTLRCKCGAKLSVPKLPEPTQRFVLGEEAARIPPICACCLEPGTREVVVSKVDTEDVGIGKIRHRRGVPFLFCEPCAQHMLWSTSQGLAIALLPVLIVAFVAGGLANALVLVSLGRRSSSVSLVVSALVVMGIGYFGYRWARRRTPREPTVEVSASHSCRFGKTVAIPQFSETYTEVRFANETYGGHFAALNE